MFEGYDFLFLKKEDGRKTMIFVWIAWLTMLLAALACVAQYGKDIPLCEDWFLVAPLTGNEPDLIGWLWEQNNEHRTPLLRLILLGLLSVFKDFRAGMYFNVLILGCLAFGLVRVACHLRGQASLADTFFPVSLLHLGNWENITFSWQVHFVLPFALICCVLMLIICDSTFKAGWTTVAVGICLLLFPLCGGIGLLWTPGLALWLLYCSCFQFFLAKDKTDIVVEKIWKRQFLCGSVILSSALLAVYFIGYEKPDWNPPSPSLGENFKTIAKFMSLGFGPSVAQFWGLAVLIAFCFLLSTTVLISLSFCRDRGLKRHQTLGLLLFFANAGLFSFAIGWSRTGLVPILGGLPPRYVHLSLLTFLAVFFIWEIYGKPRYRSAVQYALLIVVLCLLPLNTWTGFQQWGSWYRQGMQSFESDMASGMSYELLAKRHKDFLIPWWSTEQLVVNMRMLDNANIGPFANRERLLSLSDE